MVDLGRHGMYGEVFPPQPNTWKIKGIQVQVKIPLRKMYSYDPGGH